MNATLLFDLDNTLLGNDMGVFLPAYFQSLASVFQDIQPDLLYAALAQSSQAMFANQDPERILEEVFDEVFYSQLGRRKPEYQTDLTHFYREGYPKIRTTTRVFPEATQVVESARERGFRLVIATNPLFPQTAIYQRLQWAGFANPERYFEFITSYENIHFTKPNPSYYAEILARLGWPEGPVVMIGDNPINDVQGAETLGLATYHLRPGMENFKRTSDRHAAGPLAQVFNWMDGQAEEQLQPNFDSPAAMVAIARSTYACLDFWLGREKVPWDWKIGSESWSIQEIVCHLRDVEEAGYAARLDLFEREEDPFLPGLDTESWYEVRNYDQASGEQALSQFFRERKFTIEKLSDLAEPDWEKPARHAIFGPTNFLESMQILAGHDQIHIRQIFDILKLNRKERIH